MRHGSVENVDDDFEVVDGTEVGAGIVRRSHMRLGFTLMIRISLVH